MNAPIFIEIVVTEKCPSKKKIILGIIIDTDLDIPPKTGVTYRLYYLSKRLTEKGLGVKIFLCNRNIKIAEDAKKLFSKSNIEFHIVPQQIFYNPTAMELLISRNLVTILQVEDSVSLLRYHSIATNLGIPICLEMHDVEATLQEKLGFKNADIKLSKAIAYFAASLSSKTICMTEVDKKELINRIGVEANKIFVIPNPIDLREFPHFGPNRKTKNILFIGNMFYWPNQNAAKFILKKLHPALTKKIAGVHFTLAGMIPENLIEIIKNKRNIFATGSTNRLNNFLKDGTIGICPVTEGSGMKVKILNYCATGLPIITTSIGAMGYENIKSLIIENDLEKYSKLIAALFNDKKKLVLLGKKNREYVKEYYDIEKISKAIIGIYKDIVASHLTPKISKNIKNHFKLPLPLWLKEKRVKKFLNDQYYIIKNEKILYSGKIPENTHR